MEWERDRETGMWFYGTEDTGGTVYFGQRGWMVAVTIAGSINRVGPFDNLDDAQDECERVLREANQ